MPLIISAPASRQGWLQILVKTDKEKEAARAEVEAKYGEEITARVAAVEADIEAAQKDKKRRAELVKALREYRREMDTKITRESRALLKERFSYPILLYEAEKVGITATGEADQNELYPNPNVPPGVERTALELYREFRENRKKLSRAPAAK